MLWLTYLLFVVKYKYYLGLNYKDLLTIPRNARLAKTEIPLNKAFNGNTLS